MSTRRIARLRALMSENEISTMMISSPENLFYYSGFTGEEALMLIMPDQVHILSDFRYEEQLKNETDDMTIHMIDSSLEQKMAELLDRSGTEKVHFEASLTYASFELMAKQLADTKLIPAGIIADRPRIIKDEAELKIIKKACEIAVGAFEDILDEIKPGRKESELAAMLEYKMRKRGAASAAFKTTVASGRRSSLPHGTASEKKIADEEIITFDFGAVYNGYCSDITRTVFVGNCTPEQKKVYSIVEDAQRKALEYLQSGRNIYQTDKTARDWIDSHGYGSRFGHGTGHGIGIKVHEAPRISSKTDPKESFAPGMVFSVEPGIYIENDFGVRIEDTVAVVNDGIEVFTKFKKQIIIL